MKLLKQIIIVYLGMNLAACSYPGALFVQETQLGLDVSLSTTDTKPVNVNFGYDRSLLSITPKQANAKDAVSLLSKTDVLIQFVSESNIQNIMITGEAAKGLTENPDAMKALFQQTPP